MEPRSVSVAERRGGQAVDLMEPRSVSVADRRGWAGCRLDGATVSISGRAKGVGRLST